MLHTPFIWLYISRYVYNGTTKVPISSEIGVRVQGSISRTCNYPGGSGKGFPLVESLGSYNGSDRGTFGELSLGEYIGLEYGV